MVTKRNTQVMKTNTEVTKRNSQVAKRNTDIKKRNTEVMKRKIEARKTNTQDMRNDEKNPISIFKSVCVRLGECPLRECVNRKFDWEVKTGIEKSVCK